VKYDTSVVRSARAYGAHRSIIILSLNIQGPDFVKDTSTMC